MNTMLHKNKIPTLTQSHSIVYDKYTFLYNNISIEFKTKCFH